MNGEEDKLIWQFNSSGSCTSQSLYGVINFRGMRHVFTPAIWKINMPPRVHFFLWLLSKSKLLPTDNLGKKQQVEDKNVFSVLS